MEHTIEIDIKKFRAIKSANIVINGITVITGENGCGKSSISKLFYHIIKTSINFDVIVDEKIDNELYSIFRLLDTLSRELSYLIKKEDYLKIRRIFREGLYNNKQLNLFGENPIITSIDLLIDYYKNIPDLKSSKIDFRIKRVKRILEEEINLKTENTKDLSIPNLLKKLKSFVANRLDKSNTLKEERPLNVLYNVLNEVFYDNPISKSYNLKEYDVPILDKEKNKLSPIHSIQNIAYIDTPVIVGIDTFAERTHWEDLNNILNNKIKNKKTSINKILENNILRGKVSNSEDELSDKSFVYIREDGSEFDLLECATGLKSFAIIQILYKNGFLNDKTVLIIDEPEAHLHPQWVVEYARLIVLLNKEIGVKFLIASHHPDMISAIKYISMKEKTEKNLNFYLAEKDLKSSFMYNFKHKGLDIEDIFSSFNIAFERMDLYGKTE